MTALTDSIVSEIIHLDKEGLRPEVIAARVGVGVTSVRGVRRGLRPRPAARQPSLIPSPAETRAIGAVSVHDRHPQLEAIRARFTALGEPRSGVRFTEDRRGSVFDLLRVDAGYQGGGEHKAWERLTTTTPEVLSVCQDFQFPGRGQKPTPVTDAEGWYRIRLALANDTGAETRTEASTVVIDAVKGDTRLAASIAHGPVLTQAVAGSSSALTEQIRVMLALAEAQDRIAARVDDHAKRLAALETMPRKALPAKTQIAEGRRRFFVDIREGVRMTWGADFGGERNVEVNRELKRYTTRNRKSWDTATLRMAVEYAQRTWGFAMTATREWLREVDARIGVQ